MVCTNQLTNESIQTKKQKTKKQKIKQNKKTKTKKTKNFFFRKNNLFIHNDDAPIHRILRV
jgi:hypothetical protein